MASESITEIFGPYPAIPAARACAEARVFSFLGRLSRMVIHVPLGSDVTAWAVDVVGCLWLDDWDDGGLVMCVGAGGAAVRAGLLDALSVADGAGAMAIQGFGPQMPAATMIAPAISKTAATPTMTSANCWAPLGREPYCTPTGWDT